MCIKCVSRNVILDNHLGIGVLTDYSKTALISSKSELFCNFSGHFVFQGMDEGNGENQRQSKLARMRFSDSAPNPQVSENGFDPQLTHTGVI